MHRNNFEVSVKMVNYTDWPNVCIQVLDSTAEYRASAGQQKPTLSLLSSLLNSLTTALERAADEKYLLLNKVKIFLFY